MNVARFGIAGVGLIGGSIALRARIGNDRVIGFDRDADTLGRALSGGVIDTSAPDLQTLARSCETLIIALPVDATGAALEALAGLQGPALVIDVASVKEPLVAAGSRVANYVGTHPMAGREQGGIGAADAGLFVNATWAHTPHPDAKLIGRTRSFIAAMGAVPLEIDAARHDSIVALTSHLPQAISVMLGSALALAASDDCRVMELCGPGMMSMLRLARSPEATWSPIVAANSGPLAERLRSMARTFDRAAEALESGDHGPLMSDFAVARSAAIGLEERFTTGGRSSTYPRPQPVSQIANPPTR